VAADVGEEELQAVGCAGQRLRRVVRGLRARLDGLIRLGGLRRADLEA
jgi:hypothetical protein